MNKIYVKIVEMNKMDSDRQGVFERTFQEELKKHLYVSIPNWKLPHYMCLTDDNEVLGKLENFGGEQVDKIQILPGFRSLGNIDLVNLLVPSQTI